MNRKELLTRAYVRKEKLNLNDFDYKMNLRLLTIEAVKHDVGKGDITTESIIHNNSERTALIGSKANGVIAGIEEACWFYSQFGIKANPLVKDGEKVEPGQNIIELKGKESDLLKTERTGLNLLQRMSGIATLTHSLVAKASPMMVAATRKTHWGLLDNKAVFCGGGATHRLGLWESILIKDNHLESLSKEGKFDSFGDLATEAIKRAWENKDKANFIEIEVTNKEQVLRVAKIFGEYNSAKDYPCIIMLDNFPPEDAKKTVELIKDNKLIDYVLVEASGGITPENITKYRDSGVDVVSLGYLTHSPKSLDINQMILPVIPD